jgi:VWFA-related protein
MVSARSRASWTAAAGTLLVVVVVGLLPGISQAQQPFPGEPATPPQSSQPQSPASTQPESQSQSQPFPGEPANPPPQPQQSAPAEVPSTQIVPPTFRINTSIVLVPTLVEHDGETIYGLKPTDFLLLDNGVKQKLTVDAEMDSAPVSLVICIQRSRDATLEFDNFARLGPLLQLFTGDGKSEVGLVEFDSKPLFMEPFDRDTTYVERDLANMQEGDGGAAILDAVSYSLNLLEQQPPDHRRVLLLISETRDHGSRHVSIPQLVERIGTTNTLVFSVAFRPGNAEMLDWAKGNISGGGLLGIFKMAANAMRKNTPRTLSEMSGGEYEPFSREKGFESRVARVAGQARNRYLLSFHPSDLTPGLHILQVKLTQDYNAAIIARTSYWAINSPAAPPLE